MKKRLKVLILPVLLYIGYEILTNSDLILSSVLFSYKIWESSIFPSLFPFFILSSLLINYGFIELTSELFKPVMWLFGIDSRCSFILLSSLVSGYPSSALYTMMLYDEGVIDSATASKVLTFTHFSNPLFLLGTLSIVFLNSKEAGLLILICHYIGNIMIGILFRNYNKSNGNYRVNIKDGLFNMTKRINHSSSIGSVLTDAIKSTISTLLTILGTITVFLVLTTIINSNIHLNSFYQSVLNGIFELTQGLKYVSLLNIPLRLKSVISCLLISFGGLSVHLQVISIINGTDIKYTPFLCARIIHSMVSSLLVYIFFDLWMSMV